MKGGKRQQALLAVFDRLDEARQDALLEFAGVLAARDDGSASAVKRSGPEPRPVEESVVAAIKRLTRSYPAAGRRRLMGPVSMLMAQHALQGRGEVEVIDELEVLYARHHEEKVRSNG